jgi:hypothetical protein
MGKSKKNGGKFWRSRKSGIMEAKNAYFCSRNQKMFNLFYKV